MAKQGRPKKKHKFVQKWISIPPKMGDVVEQLSKITGDSESSIVRRMMLEGWEHVVKPYEDILGDEARIGGSNEN